MLKTPRFPVWLCCINGSHSVAFSANRLLLSDWRKERVFHLYYYNGQRSQTSTARLTVGEVPLPPTQTQLLLSARLIHCLSVCQQILAPTTGRRRPQTQTQREGFPH